MKVVRFNWVVQKRQGGWERPVDAKFVFIGAL
jgi:hypothetical protein